MKQRLNQIFKRITTRQITRTTTGVFSAVLFLTAATAGAADGGRIISVSGKVFYKPDAAAEWAPLPRGGNIAEGTQIKTDKDSFARILTPKGEIVKIPSSTEQKLSFTAADPAKAREGGSSQFVDEFLSDNTRTRINAVRGATLDPVDQDWLALVGLDSAPADRIESFMELAAALERKGKSGRALFVTWKLHRLFPDDPGLKALADRSIADYAYTGKWDVSDGAETVANLAGTDKKSAMKQIRYLSNEESYVYLFRTARDKDGKITTQRLFPEGDDVTAVNEQGVFACQIAPSSVVSAKEAGVTLAKENAPLSETVATVEAGQKLQVLAYEGRRFQVKTPDGKTGWVLKHKVIADDTGKAGSALAVVAPVDGRNIDQVWGFAAPGPMPETTVKTVITSVEKELGTPGSSLTHEKLSTLLPNICASPVALSTAR